MKKFPLLAGLAALAASSPAAPLADVFATIDALDRVDELSRDELVALKQGLAAIAEEFRDAERTNDHVGVLQEVADGVSQVRAAEQKIEQLDAQVASLFASIAGPGDPTAGNGTTTVVTRPKLGQVRPPTTRTPRRPVAASVGRAQQTVRLGLNGEATSMQDVARAMTHALASSHTNTVVASIETKYPDDRHLREGDTARNDRIIDEAVSPAALTAAGGICGPVGVDYTIPVWGVAERPLRGALARFGADRGGITFTPPPSLSVVSAATSIWTEATDASPGGATKAILDIDCGTPETVLVDAVVTRLRFGNMQGRFQPELVEANTLEALAAAARVAEVNLWNKIDAALPAPVTSAQVLGATRDLLATVSLACAALRYRSRLGEARIIRFVAPTWVREMIRTDLAKELAHDRSGDNNLAVSDAQIDAYFAARNVSPIWTLDGQPVNGTVWPSQQFAAQGAGALAGWPAKVKFTLFAEGSFQFLDGGELNLGVVRDSTLNATNRYETFVETFENVAFRGAEGMNVVATVAPTGASSGTVTPA